MRAIKPFLQTRQIALLPGKPSRRLFSDREVIRVGPSIVIGGGTAGVRRFKSVPALPKLVNIEVSKSCSRSTPGRSRRCELFFIYQFSRLVTKITNSCKLQPLQRLWL